MFVFRPRAKGEPDFEIIYGSIGLLLLIAAWFWPLWKDFYASYCPLKGLAGIPCILCGGTRAMHAWTHGHFAEAWTWNPLAATLGALLTLFVPYALGVTIWPNAKRLRWNKRKSQSPWAWRAAVLSLLAANWAYLIWIGR